MRRQRAKKPPEGVAGSFRRTAQRPGASLRRTLLATCFVSMAPKEIRTAVEIGEECPIFHHVNPGMWDGFVGNIADQNGILIKVPPRPEHLHTSGTRTCRGSNP